MTEPTPTPYSAPAPAPAGPPTNVLAIIALIAAFVIAPAGIVLGIIAQNQIKTTGEGGAGLAKAGLILGIVFTVIYLIVIVLSFVLPLILFSAYAGYGY